MSATTEPDTSDGDSSLESIVTKMNARRELLIKALNPPTHTPDATLRGDARPIAVNSAYPRRTSSTAERSKDDPVENPWLSIGQTLFAQWWEGHPANIAVKLAQDAIADQARRNPLYVVATGAVIGSGVVLFKPWRHLGIASTLLGVLAANRSGILDRALDVVKMVGRRR
jgi:hypothetical protein